MVPIIKEKLTKVELSHKAVEVVVFEVVRQNIFGKLVRILHNEGITFLQQL